MADKTLWLAFITCLWAWPTSGGSFLSLFAQQCLLECPAKYFSSTYKLPCRDRCRTDGYSYYWCNTEEGWDYCSPSPYVDYKGRECSRSGSCRDRGNGYRECYLNSGGGWSTCGRVEPRALTYYTRYSEECIDDCQYSSSGDYFWCHTKDNWEYCSPLRDHTYKGEPCRINDICSSGTRSYTWCYTTYNDDWDYCGQIRDGECSYEPQHYRRKRQTDNPSLICRRRDNDDNNNWRVTNFINKGGEKFIARVTNKEKKQALDLINQWDCQGLGGSAKSSLISCPMFRIDLQNNAFDQNFYNLQIQFNRRRTPGQSTTVAQILVPLDTSAEYMREAFKYSLQFKARIGIVTEEEENKKKPCCRRRKK